jgi:hypothetical protein
MTLKPRNTIDDQYIDGLNCAICGQSDLRVAHLSKYPDFVSCGNCGSAFVVEDQGSWIMYGKVPSEYPETSEFALRQWTWLDAVRERATDEREGVLVSSPEPTQPPGMESAPFTEDAPPPEDGHGPEIEAVEPIEEAAPTLTDTPIVSPFVDQSRDDSFSVPPSAGSAIEETFAPKDEELIPSDSQPSSGVFPPPPTVSEPLVDEAAEEEPPAEESDTEEPLAAPVSPFFIEPESDFLESTEEATFLPEESAQPIDAPKSGPFAEQIEPDQAEVSPFIDRLEKEISTPLPDRGSEAPLTEERVDPPPPFGSPIAETSDQAVATVADAPAEAEFEDEDDVPEGEPEEGFRYRVLVQGSQLKFPKNVCAHCLRRPVSLGATVRGTLPDPNNPGERNPLAFSLPLCRDCKRRADARSEEEKSALLQAHLISGIVAVFLVVIALVAGLVNVGTDPMISIFVLLLLGVLGYGLPAVFLLSRANRFPPPYDAAYVLSTLLVVDDAGDIQTAFEWRNDGYAELFRQVNRQNAIGETMRVTDQMTLRVPTESGEELPSLSPEKMDQPPPDINPEELESMQE